MSKTHWSPVQTLWEDSEFILSREAPPGGSESLLVLAPASERPSPATVRRLEYLHSLRERLDSAWFARPLAIVSQDGRPALLLEDPGGTVLEQRLDRPLELPLALRVGIGIASALGRFHALGFIHRNLNPSSVFIDFGTGEARLVGAYIAPRSTREGSEPPEPVGVSLASLAPEQTGRMNLPTDSRSDLYSFGVMLYRMVTGVLPFIARDPMEWIHCHLAVQPMPPNERTKTVPAQLSAIIMKLLAKMPEERYQTATGVEKDLKRCLETLESGGQIAPFPLGMHDVPDQLLISEKLYGRDSEIQTLLSAFKRVASDGRPELLLVSGYSAKFRYWVRKLQAHLYAGDYASAAAAAAQVQDARWRSQSFFEVAEYPFYSGLALAGLYPSASTDERIRYLDTIAAYQKLLSTWARNCPENFACKYPGLTEERVVGSPGTGLDSAADRLDSAAIVKALQAISGEIVLGKLIKTLMRIAVEHAGAQRGLFLLISDNSLQIEAEAATINGRVEVILQSAATDSPDGQEHERLTRSAVIRDGSVRTANRGGESDKDGNTTNHPETISLRDERDRVFPHHVAAPQSILQYVLRTRENVMLEDASVRNLFSDDEYLHQRQPKSVLCMPITRQDEVVGIVYLENNLATHAFTSYRIDVLELLASHAAISLENARLYSERKRSEEALRASEKVARGQVEALIYSLDVLATASEPEKFLGKMLSTICRQLSGQSAALWLYDEPTESMTLQLIADSTGTLDFDGNHLLAKTPRCWGKNSGYQELLFAACPILCEDTATDPRLCAEMRNYFSMRGIKKFLSVPIFAEGDREDANRHLRQAGELARMSLSEARRSVHALRPQALEEVNFWQALKGMVKSTTVGTLLQTRFEAKGKVPILPPAWQENLLRIGQEALSNTLKYAHARQFRTRLTSSAKELRLDLCDDGDGFRVRERHDGVGLTGMRERVQEMGGELKIVSSRGKGTKIAVILPKDAVRQPAVQAKIPRTNTSLVKNPAL